MFVMLSVITVAMELCRMAVGAKPHSIVDQAH